MLELVPLLANLLDRIFPDPKVAADAKLEVMKLAQSGELAQLNANVQLATGQTEVNKAEASNASLFVSGWRPWCGWVGGISLAYASIIEPMGRFVATVGFHYTGTFPQIDTDVTLQVLLGLLGLSGMRTFERVKGAIPPQR